MKFTKLFLKSFTLLVVGMLTFCMMPTQAFASAGYRVRDEVSPADYQLYEAVVDRLNEEYGTTAWLASLSEIRANRLPLPKTPTPERLAVFEKDMREFLVFYEVNSLQAQVEFARIYLDPYTTYAEGTPPSVYTNSSPWAIEIMFSYIDQEGLGAEVVQFIAERNEAFAAAALQRGYTLDVVLSRDGSAFGNEDSSLVQNRIDVYPQSRGTYSVTHTLNYLALGNSKVTGVITNNSGSWKWSSTSSAAWTPNVGWPFFTPSATPTRYLSNSNACCDVYYSGQITNFDINKQIYVYTQSQFYVYHYASSAASQNGL